MKKNIFCMFLLTINLLYGSDEQNKSCEALLQKLQCKPIMWNSVKDVSAAYLLATAIVMSHELGHALASKLLYGVHRKIFILMLPCKANNLHFKLGCFEFWGAQFPFGLSSWAGQHEVEISQIKDAIILSAGPFAGACFSWLAYKLIKKYAPSYTITKLMALWGLFGNTVGQALLAFKYPWADFGRLWQIMKGSSQSQNLIPSGQ